MRRHAITPGFGRGDCERSQNESARQSSTIDRPKRFLNAALKYSSTYGWPVHPLHEIVDGECSCKLGTECGQNAGKHPRVKWKDQASGEIIRVTDPEIIRRWWSKWPTANIGLPTGDGIAVLDIDPRYGGDEELAKLEAENGTLRETPQTLTGGGGSHYWFSIDEPLRGCDLAPGIELKADGEQVVLPPSIHPSGRRYEWELSSHPDDIPLAPLPSWLREKAVSKNRGSDHDRSPGWFAQWLQTPISGGGRRKPEGLPRAIGYLAGKGFDNETIIAILALWDFWNSARCKVEPLGEIEIRRHVESMRVRYGYKAYGGAHLTHPGGNVHVEFIGGKVVSR
jgi:hypothetical protein